MITIHPNATGDIVETLKGIVLVLHLLGMAAIISGVLAQRRATPRRIDALILHGALTQLVTGVALVGLVQATEDDVNNPKFGVKLLVLLVITFLAWRDRKAEAVATSVWAAIGLLTVANVAIAVLWR